MPQRFMIFKLRDVFMVVYIFILVKLKIRVHVIVPFLTGHIQIIKINLYFKNRIALTMFNSTSILFEKL